MNQVGNSDFQNIEVCIKEIVLLYNNPMDSLKEDFMGIAIFTEVAMPQSWCFRAFHCVFYL